MQDFLLRQAAWVGETLYGPANGVDGPVGVFQPNTGLVFCEADPVLPPESIAAWVQGAIADQGDGAQIFDDFCYYWIVNGGGEVIAMGGADTFNTQEATDLVALCAKLGWTLHTYCPGDGVRTFHP